MRIDRAFAEAGWCETPSIYGLNPVGPRIGAAAARMRRLFLGNDPFLAEAAAEFAQDAACHLLGSIDAELHTPKYKLTNKHLKDALDFVNDNIDRPLSVDQVAKITGLSLFHFAHAFKSAVGQSTHQYIIDRRMTRARELLAESVLGLADIAYATGYSSQSHMTACFTKRLGLTPQQYRRELGRKRREMDQVASA